MILTSAGDYFRFEAPGPFDIETIALSLAKLCRFVGHTREFYSVAQHSVHVSEIVPREFALEGLMHDAHEAFVGDVSSPLKRKLPDYERIELRAAFGLRRAYGLPLVTSPEVDNADLVMLATEKRDFLPTPKDPRPEPWLVIRDIAPLERHLAAWTWEVAARAFLARYESLVKTSGHE